MLTPVRTPDAKAPLVQLWEQLHWGARLLATPNDYRIHRLYRKGRGPGEALRYLSGPRAEALFPALNREPELLVDKLAYENHFRAVGLPVPRTLAVTAPTEHVGDRPVLGTSDRIADFLRERLGAGQQLVLKMLDAERGIGVRVLTGIDGEDLLLSNGQRARVDSTADGLLGSGRVWLIQERIVQHPDIDAFNSSSLNTLRLVTFRHRNGDVEIPICVLSLGRATNQTDGFAAGGGVVVRIDLATGRLPDSGVQSPRFSYAPVERHPDSGVPFAGRTVPNWPEVVELARAFAAHAGANRYIGWDVASTTRGPVFVEGNEDFDVGFVQLQSDGMLTDEFVELMREEAGIDYEVTQLPPARPLHALRTLRKRFGPDTF